MLEQVLLTVDTVNAAFEEDPGAELARVLRAFCDQLDAGERPNVGRDINGNVVLRVRYHHTLPVIVTFG